MEKPRGDLSEASPVPSGEPVTGGIHTVTHKKVIAVRSLSTTP